MAKTILITPASGSIIFSGSAGYSSSFVSDESGSITVHLEQVGNQSFAVQGSGSAEIFSVTAKGKINLGAATDAEERLEFESGSVSGSASSTGSFGYIYTQKAEIVARAPNDFFLLKSSSFDSLIMNGQGVLTLGGFSFDPTAVAGGFYYSSASNEFYLGKR